MLARSHALYVCTYIMLGIFVYTVLYHLQRGVVLNFVVNFRAMAIYMGCNHWVWLRRLPINQEIKSKSQVNQAIKESFRVRSSDQEINLAIKIFDRRRRWKYGAHSGDSLVPRPRRGRGKSGS